MKTYIVTGCYGSGKTEFCVNFALDIRKRTDTGIYIADMDILNPYFRSREKDAYLRERGIEIVGNAMDNIPGNDLPAVSYSFLSLITKAECVIMDLAGSENGLKVMAQCYDRIREYELLCVLNLFRPDSGTVEKMLQFVRNVNAISRFPVTGIVNNGHMLHETESEHILLSQKACLEVCAEMNIPLRYTQLRRDIYDSMKDKIESEEVIVFDKLQMRERWQ